jgi:hypothetical protein
MINIDSYTQTEIAYYFAAQAVASLVYLEGGYILRRGLNSETVDKPYEHNYCDCGGIRGEVSEIAIKLLGGLAVSKVVKGDFEFSNHEDFPKAEELARKLNKTMGIMAVGTEIIINSAETRALRMIEEIWPAIEELAQSILRFRKLDRVEATSIVKKALKGKNIEKCSLSWLFN